MLNSRDKRHGKGALKVLDFALTESVTNSCMVHTNGDRPHVTVNLDRTVATKLGIHPGLHIYVKPAGSVVRQSGNTNNKHIPNWRGQDFVFAGTVSYCESNQSLTVEPCNVRKWEKKLKKLRKAAP